jgi:hypothetical protein
MIRIVPPKPDENGRLQLGMGTTVFDEAGIEIEEIIDLTIRIAIDEVVTAKVTVGAQMSEVWARPFMSEASFLDAAEVYGYTVKKKD